MLQLWSRVFKTHLFKFCFHIAKFCCAHRNVDERKFLREYKPSKVQAKRDKGRPSLTEVAGGCQRVGYTYIIIIALSYNITTDGWWSHSIPRFLLCFCFCIKCIKFIACISEKRQLRQSLYCTSHLKYKKKWLRVSLEKYCHCFRC